MPEELADETLDRVARKLQEGTEIRTADPYRYITGVAYRLFQEKVREKQRQLKRKNEYQVYAQRTPTIPDEGEEIGKRRLACLNQCLLKLEECERQLILRYHEGEKGDRIRNRRALAQELNLAITTLRVRAHRIRDRLEKCTRDCVSAG
jgi:DNA-directed RNA polymerase specialized sigma24 family protein